MGECRLFRKRLIPEECVELKDDEVLRLDENVIVTRWKCLKPRQDFFGGISCYLLKKGIKISKILKEDGSLLFWYCDIIKTEYTPETKTYIFTDLLADVVILPDGYVKVLDLDELAESGLIAKGAARLPEGETEPQPRPGECVLLATHVDRGFSLPLHPFFRAS